MGYKTKYSFSPTLLSNLRNLLNDLMIILRITAFRTALPNAAAKKTFVGLFFNSTNVYVVKQNLCRCLYLMLVTLFSAYCAGFIHVVRLLHHRRRFHPTGLHIFALWPLASGACQLTSPAYRCSYMESICCPSNDECWVWVGVGLSLTHHIAEGNFAQISHKPLLHHLVIQALELQFSASKFRLV